MFRLSLAILALIICLCAVATVATAAAGQYRRTGAFAVVLTLCLALGWFPLRPAIEPAYPTSYYAPSEPYAAASIVRGAALYTDNCALCHGASGHGDGPVAASLPIWPADLTQPHLFAHSTGDLFWWVSHGMDEGVMPAFADVLSPNRRSNVINFVRARAAGVLAGEIGPEVTTATSPEVPDFAFETGDRQSTLAQMLETGPVLLVLFEPPAPIERRQQLTTVQVPFSNVSLRVVAVGLVAPSEGASERRAAPPCVVDVTSEVISTLTLFRAVEDGGETELMLDRGANVRARWTSAMHGGLPSPVTLIATAQRVARIALAAPSHASHPH